MREWWANVYADEPEHWIGDQCGNRDIAVSMSQNMERGCALRTTCRLHVRLKPEGAPRRYADSHERRAWENWPGVMTRAKKNAKWLLDRYRSGIA